MGSAWDFDHLPSGVRTVAKDLLRIRGQPVVCQDAEGWQYATGWGSRDWRAAPRLMLDVVRARKWTMKYTLNFVAQAQGCPGVLDDSLNHFFPTPIGKTRTCIFMCIYICIIYITITIYIYI